MYAEVVGLFISMLLLLLLLFDEGLIFFHCVCLESKK